MHLPKSHKGERNTAKAAYAPGVCVHPHKLAGSKHVTASHNISPLSKKKTKAAGLVLIALLDPSGAYKMYSYLGYYLVLLLLEAIS